ncbi:MAG: methylmalonyl-CoA mutase family protein [Dehalococcoidia bacterium]|nr:methylmalonyl-CoA mutase family protein [Dehalococcoidia bacterium]
MGESKHARHELKHRVRVVTATALFDGHDAAINIMRRLIQAGGAEVIHLGHSRSVGEVVEAAIQEDVQAVAVSSYQGGHMEFFKYMKDMFDKLGAGHIRIFGGGGGVIRPNEIKELQDYGIERIYDPEDGRNMGLVGMIDDLLQRCDFHTIGITSEHDKSKRGAAIPSPAKLNTQEPAKVARMITLAEMGVDPWHRYSDILKDKAAQSKAPVIGITGTGGSGKSSLLDELVLRFRADNPGKTVAVLSADPSKRRTGGALLGDRIRMNYVYGGNVYMRSLSTRGSKTEVPEVIQDAIAVVKAAGYDLVMVETAGIGQGDTAIVDISDVCLYVMTAEFGAPTQLEKIDMLDFADIVVLNKYDKKGSEDALRDVRRVLRRTHEKFDAPLESMPVYGTIASRYNDEGVNGLYARLLECIHRKCGRQFICNVPEDRISHTSAVRFAIPPDHIRYLGEIAETVRDYKKGVHKQSEIARHIQELRSALVEIEDEPAREAIEKRIASLHDKLKPECRKLLAGWDELRRTYSGDYFRYSVRGQEYKVELIDTTLAGTNIPRVIVPDIKDHGERLKYLMLENVPGHYPYTAGVFPFRRKGEDPKRQFAGEGGPVRTNTRFHFLSQNDEAKRLSTAFDAVTLFGEDPQESPDIFGKIGESGVSICTLEDIKKLYAGFDLCSPNTSVSMTINGPAPVMLAFFLNAAIDQQVDSFTEQHGRMPAPDEHARIKAQTLSIVRGTVQADILKEDQGQNSCIFSIEFALKMMGDIQEYFINHNVRNYYSVSISGYHIAEAGANPITQVAFTLANGFTYVEYYLSRGFPIDSFAPNLSFFFSNGMDAEYTVIGRVARRIWAVAMREKYGGNERSQQLKYHIQTSGRSLHAQEIQFNDIRTTLQAVLAFYDNCNSLHTNSYDEAITTPTEESVRRAMAIQLIITREFGLTKNENVWQGSYILEQLTDLVEEAILDEFERISKRGGVLGGMELQYQRGKIQDESMLYEQRKHSAELPIIGVNTFLNPREGNLIPFDIPLSRSTREEKQDQIVNLRSFQKDNSARARESLKKLQQVAREGGNIFEQMMETARYASLGQITGALYEVGGKYRRNM